MPPCCSCFVPAACLPVFHESQNSCPSLPLQVIRVLSSLSSLSVPYSVSGLSFPLLHSGFLLQSRGETKSSRYAPSTFSPIHPFLPIPSGSNINSFPLLFWNSPCASTHNSFWLTFQLASWHVSLASSFSCSLLRTTASWWSTGRHLSLLDSARTEIRR